MFIKILSSAFIFTSLWSTPALAKDNDQRHGWKMMQELNLSKDQIQQVKQIKEKYKTEPESQKKELKAAKEDLVKSVQAPQKGPEYRAQLLEKFKQVQSLKQAYALKKFEMALEVRELLTDEQIKKFRALHKGHHGHDK